MGVDMRPRVALIAGVVVVCAVSALYVDAVWPLAAQAGQRSPQFRRMLLDDKGLRRQATHAPAPSYPAASLTKKVSGVAVATVTTDANGTTERVEILEAPDEAIGQAVRAAAAKWTYKPAGLPLTGTLIFYFHIREGRGVVSSPDEMKVLKGQAPTTAKEEEAPVKEIAETELARLESQVRPVILDIRDRQLYQQSHRAGAVSIPLRELLTRAGAELPRSRPIVIDCFADLYASNACRVAGHFLTSSGFTQVLVLRR